METYNYVVIMKEDCMEGEHTQDNPTHPFFSKDKLNALLTQYGEGGYRVISTLYNSPNDWVLILSRQKYPEKRVGRMG